MVSIAGLTEHYKQAFTEQQAKVLVEGAVAIEHDLVNREDFSKLTATVDRLADRMGGLAERMDGLAVAQGRTEERMDRLASAQERTEERMDRLASAQERTEERMDRLAAAQERTEERMDRLASAQERTEGNMSQLDQTMKELAAAQERTEENMSQLDQSMKELAESQRSMQQTFERSMARADERQARLEKSHKRMGKKMDRSFIEVRQELRGTADRLETKMDSSFADVRKQLGGLSLSVGMGLEANALDRIPRLLEMHCSFQTDSVFPETFTDGERSEEIDVVVRGSIAGRPVVVVCEVKTNITQTEVGEFFARVARVRSRLDCDDVRVLFFGYRAAAETHGMIEEAGGWLALPAGILRINREAG